MTELGERVLTMQVVHDGTTTRIVPMGELDMASANTFETVAEQVVLSQPERIELDLAGVQFIDSTGLRSIIMLRNRARLDAIELRVTGLSPAAERILELTGLIDELRRS
jgi:anti-sigma B factor antagonist